MAIVNNSTDLDELSFQKHFYKTYYGKNWENIVQLDRNTDGYTKDIFFEHKKNASAFGEYSALSQAIIYLTRFNMEGVPIPAKICIVSQEEKKVSVYETKDYMTDYIEKVDAYASMSPSRGIEGFVAINNPHVIMFDIDDVVGSPDLLDFIKSTKGNVKVHINKSNVYGWSRYFYENAPKKEQKKDCFFKELRTPSGVLSNYIYPWTGQQNEFALIMDLLNDPNTQKKLGCFYSPLPYCEKAAELVRNAIKRVPEGNDYVIVDRCAGTGNLEFALSDEELSHVIINTYEMQEWIALKNRLGKSVRCILPPIPINPDELPEKNEHGFLAGSNALSKHFIERDEIRKYVDDPNCTIILYENPPYRDSSSSDKDDVNDEDEETINTTSFVFEEMKKELKNFTNSNVSTARDVVNQFIWSGFKYYLRQPTDSYVLLSPAKCFKSLGMLDYEYGGGALFNRAHFHATEASIMCTLWFNKEDKARESINVQAYDIDKKGKLVYIQDVEIKKVHTTFEKWFDRRKFEDDVETEVYCETNGKQTTGRKCDGRSFCNLNPEHEIIAYARPVANPIAPMNGYFTRETLYNIRGFYVRSDNFLEKLPLFVAKYYPLKEWWDKEVIMTSADGGLNYVKDKEFLKRCLIFTCLTQANHCVSFFGTDGHYYKNELCFDGDTLANRVLSTMNLTDIENELIKKYNDLMSEIKRRNDDGTRKYSEYDNNLAYGPYQIKLDIDIKIPKTDEKGNIIYKNKQNKDGSYDQEMVNKYGKNLSNLLNPLQKALNDYYMEFIKPKMIQYELLK